MASGTKTLKEIPNEIDAKRVTGRRKVTFSSLDDVRSDLNAIEGKRLSVFGNWSVGQILNHSDIK